MSIPIHENDAGLIRRAIEYAGGASHGREPRWSHVGKIFGVGSTSASLLCSRLGFDPDADRGGCRECGYDYEVVDGETACGCGEWEP